MKTIKSTKYRNYRMSKAQYPTRIVRGSGTTKGGISMGHVKARSVLEAKLGRKLHPDTKVRTKGGNWAFMEPL